MARFCRLIPLLVTLGSSVPCAMSQASIAPLPESSPFTVAEQFLFRSVNAERAAAGLPSLTWSRTLVHAARFHAAQMGSSHTLSHQLQGEGDLLQRASQSGAHFSRVTENVAVGPSLPQMHDALMRSPHHRENILDPNVNSVAIAVLGSHGELWAVEDFAHDLASLSFDEQEQQVSFLLQKSGIPVESTENARDTCEKSSGYVGARPGFVMRYITSDLQRLPEQLKLRIAEHAYTSAAVGACTAPSSRGFASYNIAVLLYR